MAPAESVTTEAPASSQSNVSTQVMPPGFVFNILLVSANSGLEAEIVEAWQADGKESGDPYDYALVHHSFESSRRARGSRSARSNSSRIFSLSFYRSSSFIMVKGQTLQ